MDLHCKYNEFCSLYERRTRIDMYALAKDILSHVHVLRSTNVITPKVTKFSFSSELLSIVLLEICDVKPKENKA